ncbi:hypothetical protein I0C86_30990, partial [Plantactinospora sp. S1510]
PTSSVGPVFVNPEAINWDHEEEIARMADAIAVLQKRNSDLGAALRDAQKREAEVWNEARRELAAEFREQQESFRRQLLSAQEATDNALVRAKENEGAVAELAQLRQAMSAFGNLLQPSAR